MPRKMSTGTTGPKAVAEEGVALCRAGEWDKGMQLLARAVEAKGVGDELPGTSYSFLGFAVARFQRKIRDGLKLCEHAVKVQFYEPDNHWNLARVHLLAGSRKLAVESIARGLKLDPQHAGLRGLRKEIGVRRRPVLRFLGRDNFINRLLGRIRHDLAD
jgi:hypothetical protein